MRKSKGSGKRTNSKNGTWQKEGLSMLYLRLGNPYILQWGQQDRNSRKQWKILHGDLGCDVVRVRAPGRASRIPATTTRPKTRQYNGKKTNQQAEPIVFYELSLRYEWTWVIIIMTSCITTSVSISEPCGCDDGTYTTYSAATNSKSAHLAYFCIFSAGLLTFPETKNSKVFCFLVLVF
jgi:hypothetical protein